MRKLLFALPLLAAIPFIANSATTPAAKGPDTSKITGGTYTADSNHTLVGWKVNHFGFSDYFGIMGSPTGTLTLDKANPGKSSVTIEIPLTGLTTANEKLTGHLKSPDFFNAEAFPSAKFVSTMVMVKGTTAMIHGNLTLLGVTKPVVLNAELSGSGTNMMSKKETIGFRATTSINRADWGMAKYVPAVSNKVDLNITVAFEK
jgi:polyisoprenoid-binding protein YceI